MTAPVLHVVLYDNDCVFCKWSLAKILAWDRAGRLRTIPIQSDEGERLLAAVDPERRLESWHLVSGEELYSGGAAAAPLVRLLPGGRALAELFDAFPRVTEHAYTYIARRRSLWSKLLRIDRNCDVRQ